VFLKRYVRTMVAADYRFGYGLGDCLKRPERVVGRVEHVVLFGAMIGAIVILGWRALMAARNWRET